MNQALVPPHCPEAEQAVVGALLLDGTAIARVAPALRPEDFYSTSNQGIYRAMLDLNEAGAVVNNVTVSERLRCGGRWDLRTELVRAEASVPSAADIDDFVQIVFSCARRRESLASSHRLQEALQSGAPEEMRAAAAAVTSAAEAAANSSLCSHPLRERDEEEKIRAAFQTAADLSKGASDATEWIAEPWVAAETITGLDGLPKGGGKTTFVLHLVRAVLEGRRFLGWPTRQGPVVYLTEEGRTSFLEALDRVGLKDRTDLHVLRYHASVGVAWPVVVRAAASVCQDVGGVLLVVDTFPQLAGLRGEEENQAGAVLDAVDPLRSVAATGVGVIATRHERKAQGEPGSSGRGSNAFTGAVDTLITIRRAKGGGHPNVRELRCLSRFEEAPAQLAIELVEGAFVVVGAKPSSGAMIDTKILAVTPSVKSEARREGYFAGETGYAPSSVNRSLRALVDRGKIKRVGAGGRRDPYRYWAPRAAPIGSFSSSPSSRGEENNSQPGVNPGNEVGS